MSRHRAPGEGDMLATHMGARKEPVGGAIKLDGVPASEPRPRRWLTPTRAGVIAGTVVVLLAVLIRANPFGADEPSIVEKATAALAVTKQAVLHLRVEALRDDGDGTRGDGTTSSREIEYWQATAAPYAWRFVETMPDGSVTEWSGDGRGLVQLYDPATDTVFQSSEAVVGPTGAYEQSIRAFEEQALELLRSEQTEETGHVSIDGQDAVRIVGSDAGGRSVTYTVDARIGAPIKWQAAGDNGGVTLRFIAYEDLPATPGNLTLLDLRVQHLGARVDTDPAHYQEARERLHPQG